MAALSKKSYSARIWLVAKILFSLILIGALLYHAGTDPDIHRLWNEPKRWEYFAVAFLAMIAGYTISHVRWWILSQAVAIDLSLLNAVRIGFIALPFSLIAFGVAGGDLLRTIYVCRDHPEQKKLAIASVFFDRAIGLMTMFFAVALTGFLVDWDALLLADSTQSRSLRWVCWISQVVSLVGIAAYVFVLLLGRATWVNYAAIRIRRWPGGGLIVSVLEVAVLYRNRPMTVLLSFLLSLAVVFSLSLCVYFVGLSLTPDVPTFISHFVITPVGLIAGAIPAALGIGPQEVVMSWLYSAFSTGAAGNASDTAADGGLLVAFGYRGLTFTLMALGLIVYLLGDRRAKAAIDQALQSEADAIE